MPNDDNLPAFFDGRQWHVDRGVARHVQEIHDVDKGRGLLPGARDNDNVFLGISKSLLCIVVYPSSLTRRFLN